MRATAQLVLAASVLGCGPAALDVGESSTTSSGTSGSSIDDPSSSSPSSSPSPSSSFSSSGSPDSSGADPTTGDTSGSTPTESSSSDTRGTGTTSAVVDITTDASTTSIISETSASESTTGIDYEFCYEEAWTIDGMPVDFARHVRVDAAGTAYVIGTFEGVATDDPWLAAYDADGVEQWTLVVDPAAQGVSDDDEVGLDLELHPSGDLVALVSRDDDDARATLLRLDPTTLATVFYRPIEWEDISAHMPEIVADFFTYGAEMLAVSASGVIVVHGPFDSIDDRSWLGRFDDATGEPVWIEMSHYFQTFDHPVYQPCLVVDDMDGVFSCASAPYEAMAGMGAVANMLERWSLDGDFIDDALSPGSAKFMQGPMALAPDGGLIVGFSRYYETLGSPYIHWRDEDLVLTQDVALDENPRGLTADASGNVFVVGTELVGLADVATIARLDAAGAVGWKIALDAEPDVRLHSIAVAPDDGLLVAGFRDTGFLRKYAPCEP